MIAFLIGACTETVATVLPEPPEAISASLQSRGVVLVSWSARPKKEAVVSYVVYRDGLNIGESSTATFADTAAPELKTHAYAVASKSASGILSELSESASVFAPDATPPRVQTTLPQPETTVPDAIVTLGVVFSEPLDPVSVGSDALIVRGTGSTAAIPGVVTYTQPTKTVQWVSAAALGPGLRLTATIAGVKDTAGNSMAAPFSFSVDTRTDIPPRVLEFTPADGATNVSFYARPTFTFSEPMKPFNFQIEALNGLPPITVATTFEASKQVATLRPIGPVQPLGTYRISIPSDATDADGNPIVNAPTLTYTYTRDFALPKIASTYPKSGAANVELQLSPYVAFDRPVVLVGDYKVEFDLRAAAGTTVPGSVMFDNFSSVVVYVTGRLQPLTTYTVTMTQSYADPSGNRLQDVYNWSFTTGN